MEKVFKNLSIYMSESDMHRVEAVANATKPAVAPSTMMRFLIEEAMEGRLAVNTSKVEGERVRATVRVSPETEAKLATAKGELSITEFLLRALDAYEEAHAHAHAVTA